MKESDWFIRSQLGEFGEIIVRNTDELIRIEDALPDEKGYITCPLIILQDQVVFPHNVSPIFIDDHDSEQIIAEARDRDTTVIGVSLNEGETLPDGDIASMIAVEIAVGRVMTLPDGSRAALSQGRRRVEFTGIIDDGPVQYAQAKLLDVDIKIDRTVEASMRTALGMFETCSNLDRNLPEEAYLYASNLENPDMLSDVIASSLDLSFEDQLSLLNNLDIPDRLDHLIKILAKEVELLELESEITTRARSEIERTQREFYLREQLRAIKTELGEEDPWQQDSSEIAKKFAEIDLPKEVREESEKELSRLAQMQPMSPEAAVIRTYLDWILALPWTTQTLDDLDVNHAAEILDSNHYGLTKAKERILEYIAVRKMSKMHVRQPILCFIGPPGTGKTSLGKSIAHALGREFVRVSLGGVRDEAEIRGHRRTYISALPGRILQTMRRAGTINPLFMLDEIDKMSMDFRGDPSSALLEVLDPEQNFAFSDHYLEVPYNLSDVLFITTANNIMQIPLALLDRMEVIEFPGYIEEEKIEIANKFLIPRQLEENGLEPDQIILGENALALVIREYTYEAGVRNLEREIGKICRKVVRKKAEGKRFPSRITVSTVERLLGPGQFSMMEAESEDEVGVATSLAWTENGGEIMPVEVLLVQGKGGLNITGQVGEIMQESAQAALTYMKSRSVELGLDQDAYENLDIHIHVPEGAIPKDGPSAGVTIATSLISAFTKRPVHKFIGMTGEITLRGRILPVGGVREKVLAAHRAGIKTVLLPTRNLKDLIDLPRKARSALKIIPVAHMDQIIDLAIYKKRLTKSKKPAKTVAPRKAVRKGGEIQPNA